MKTTKIVSFSLITICVISLLLLICFKVFMNNIYNQKTCVWANIDNIEMHATIDIPTVIDSECYYDKKNNIKKAYFKFNAAKVKTKDYLNKYKLQRVNISSVLNNISFLNFENNNISTSSLFLKKTKKRGETTTVLIDTLSHKIWVNICYAN